MESKYKVNDYVSGYVSSVEGGYLLASGIKTPVIGVDLDDYKGVIRAVGDLCNDIEAVTDIKPEMKNIKLSGADIVIGTIGKNREIDNLINDGKIDVSDIIGKWECFKIQVLDDKLFIIGSDKRGTIYGIYDLSEKIGVSPWYWWADVLPGHVDSLYINLNKPYTEYESSVKYRGIFMNDEYSFHKWALLHNDDDYVEAYKHIYELILRLKANLLWPAMHAYSPHFHKNNKNAENADLYGVVIGSSHCEMLLRNNLSEYLDFEKKWEEKNKDKQLYKIELTDSDEPCSYVYIDVDPNSGQRVYNKELLKDYWKDSVEKYGKYENIYTIGMRGLHDAKWQPINADSNIEKAHLLEEIISDQRKILADVLNEGESDIPQVFIPYKEIQEVYDSGMDVPDDVTLMWTDDNYGYIRQLPTDNNRNRSGGAGIYYHISYHGYPNSYIWLCTTPMALIREEMCKAFDCGVKDIWIINVGDLKPGENQIEYLLKLGRNIDATRNKDLKEYIAEKAKRDFKFSKTEASEYADIALEFQRLAYARKPEFFGADNFNYEGYGMTEEERIEALANKPEFVLEELFNCEAFGDEGQNYIDEYQDLVERSEKLYNNISDKLKPAFYELQLYPLRCSCNTSKKYVYAVKSNLYYREGRCVVANKYAEASDELYYYVIKDTKLYNSMINKKWNGIMEPYQTFFRSCGATLPALFETSKATGHKELGVAYEKMTFSGYSKDTRFIDIYNMGYNRIEWRIINDKDYIEISKCHGSVLNDTRLWIKINWDKVTHGIINDNILIEQIEDEKVTNTFKIPIIISNNTIELPEKTYAESNGYISIKAEHYSHMQKKDNYTWNIEKYLGRQGNAIKSYPNLAKSIVNPNIKNSAYVEYNIYFESIGTFDIDIYRIPTLNERGNVRFAISIDDLDLKKLYGNKVYVNDSDGKDSWGKGVLENNEIITTNIKISEPGIHKLRIYSIDMGVVIEKIVITTGNKEKSYFGPPESYNSTYNKF